MTPYLRRRLKHLDVNLPTIETCGIIITPMDKSPHSAHPHPTSGGLIRLQAQLVDLATWLCPAWAALCGVVASGGFAWQGEGWSRLALLILLVDGGWGTLWTALGSTNWAAALHQWRTWEFGERTPKPPYTLPDSPGDRDAGRRPRTCRTDTISWSRLARDDFRKGKGRGRSSRRNDVRSVVG